MEPLSCSAVLTHHWLVRIRGGEKVLLALRELLPRAPIYTLVCDSAAFAAAASECGIQKEERCDAAAEIHTSLLQHIPGAVRHYPKLLPLMPFAARRVKLPPVDLVLCSDAALAKAMTPHPRSKLVCYCHSPMRYAFEDDIAGDYARTLPAALRPAWPLVRRYVRDADRRAAERVDRFIANSQTVAERIRRHYGRESIVIHPPVDVPAGPAPGAREPYYLCVGHHVRYKRLDLAIEACRRLGRRLTVIGDGPEADRQRRRPGRHVTLLGWQPDELVKDHYRRAAALLFPGEEDFGIVPVEAMGHGCPVIAYAAGGARETVIPDTTGVWFEQQTVESLATAIERFETLQFDPRVLHAHALRFRRERFLSRMRDALTNALSPPESLDGR
jgi:glycosyltransferase involved in cell wall biosynthesis